MLLYIGCALRLTLRHHNHHHNHLHTTEQVRLPDERFDALCTMWHAPSEIPAWLNVTDIAGGCTRQT